MYLFMAIRKAIRPEIWYKHSPRLPRPDLKTFFCFFEEMTLRTASLDKLPSDVDFPPISSISLFSY